MSSGYLRVNGKLAAFLDVRERGPDALGATPWRQLWPREGIVISYLRGGMRGEFFFPQVTEDTVSDIGDVNLGSVDNGGYELHRINNVCVWRETPGDAFFAVILSGDEAPAYFFRLVKP